MKDTTTTKKQYEIVNAKGQVRGRRFKSYTKAIAYALELNNWLNKNQPENATWSVREVAA